MTNGLNVREVLPAAAPVVPLRSSLRLTTSPDGGSGSPPSTLSLTFFEKKVSKEAFNVFTHKKAAVCNLYKQLLFYITSTI